MSRSFQPLFDKPRWELLYDVFTARRPGDVVTYTELLVHLNDGATVATVQSEMERVKAELSVNCKIAVRVVRRVGYRIVQPREHLGVAQEHQTKARRSLDRGRQAVVNVDRDALDPPTRAAFDVVTMALSRQQDFMRSLDIRQQKLENALKAVNSRTDSTHEQVSATQEQVAELNRRIAELEARQQRNDPPGQ